MTGRPKGRPKLEIEFQWLVNTAADIKAGATTLEAARRNCKVKNKLGHYRPRTVSSRFLASQLKVIDDRYEAKLGRPIHRKNELIESEILKVHERTKMGATKCYEKIVTESRDNYIYQTISHRLVYATFQEKQLLQFQRPKKVEKYRCRYVACNPNLIWHTDLHDWKKEDSENREYLIAFIDDFSRKIMHVDIIPNKIAITTSHFLKHALELNGKPFSIWTDNGGEFKAEFERVLIENNIHHVWTAPHNPQQNGKVERF